MPARELSDGQINDAFRGIDNRWGHGEARLPMIAACLAAVAVHRLAVMRGWRSIASQVPNAYDVSPYCGQQAHPSVGNPRRCLNIGHRGSPVG